MGLVFYHLEYILESRHSLAGARSIFGFKVVSLNVLPYLVLLELCLLWELVLEMWILVFNCCSLSIFSQRMRLHASI